MKPIRKPSPLWILTQILIFFFESFSDKSLVSTFVPSSRSIHSLDYNPSIFINPDLLKYETSRNLREMVCSKCIKKTYVPFDSPTSIYLFFAGLLTGNKYRKRAYINNLVYQALEKKAGKDNAIERMDLFADEWFDLTEQSGFSRFKSVSEYKEALMPFLK